MLILGRTVCLLFPTNIGMIICNAFSKNEHKIMLLPYSQLILLCNRNLLECPVSIRFLNDKYVRIADVGREALGKAAKLHHKIIYTSVVSYS